MTYIPASFECSKEGCTVRRDKDSNRWFELHFEREDTGEGSLYLSSFKGNTVAEHYCGEPHLLEAISAKLELLQDKASQKPVLLPEKENQNES